MRSNGRMREGIVSFLLERRTIWRRRSDGATIGVVGGTIHLWSRFVVGELQIRCCGRGSSSASAEGIDVAAGN